MKEENEWGSLQKDPVRYEHYEVNRYPDRTAQGSPESKRKERKRGSFAKKLCSVIFLGCIFGLAAAAVFLPVAKRWGVTAVQDSSDEAAVQIQPLDETQVLPEQISGKAERASSIVDSDQDIAETVEKYGVVAGVAKAVMPSIVAITSVSIQEIPNYFGFGFGYGYREYPSTGSGSGIIVGENEEELLIATNNHVVEGASTLSVCFIGNDVVDAEKETEAIASGYGDINVENAISAKIKGTDSDNDLAVIAVKKSDIPADTMSRIKIAKLNDTDDPVVGEQVVAIGNALGYGQSVTVGYISALNRTLTDSDGDVTSDLIQTDAAINPGNSGGALLNMQGEVIGINSAKYAADTVEGMGYAIPIAKAEPILEELMSRETRDRVEDEEKAAFLGVGFADLSSDARQMYGIPAGAFVARVYSGGAADQAGMMKGDVIEKLDGQKISGKTDLQEKLKYYSAGEKVEIQIARFTGMEYEELTLNVTFGSRADFGY